MPKGRTTRPRVGRVISKRADEAEAPARGTEAVETGRQSVNSRPGAEACTATSEQTKSEDHLMERVVERSNLWLAYQRVVKNKGAPGVDDLTVAEFNATIDQTHPRAVTQRAWSFAHPYHRDSEPAAARLDQLLPAHAEQIGSGGARRVGTATVALSAVETVETAPDPRTQALCPGLGDRASLAQCHERSWSLVERWREPHEPCRPCGLLHEPGAALPAARAAATPVRSLNRRMRNRTYGGVGGGLAQAYPSTRSRGLGKAGVSKDSSLGRSGPRAVPGYR